MTNFYQIYLISDSTGETLDRIFLALKAQFNNFRYKTNHFSFTRTENQVLKILEDCKKKEKIIILYTIVDDKLSNFLNNEAKKNNIPCFSVLGDLISSFSELLNQNALNVPSRQHIMNDEYYKKIDAFELKRPPICSTRRVYREGCSNMQPLSEARGPCKRPDALVRLYTPCDGPWTNPLHVVFLVSYMAASSRDSSKLTRPKRVHPSIGHYTRVARHITDRHSRGFAAATTQRSRQKQV